MDLFLYMFSTVSSEGSYLPLPPRLSIQGLWARLSRDMEHELNPLKGLSPPPTQYLKAIGLWVILLIYWRTFSFLLNVGPTLTIESLTLSVVKNKRRVFYM